MNATILCYPKCSTCRKAEKWLKDNGIEYTYRAIKEENPTKDELLTWINKSGLHINKFFNTSGLVYKEMNMKDKIKSLSEEERISILASNGLLVKRPILLFQDKVMVGFDPEQWKSIF